MAQQANKSKSETERQKAYERIRATEKADKTNTILGVSFGLMALFIFLAIVDYLGSLKLPLEWIDYVIFAWSC